MQRKQFIQYLPSWKLPVWQWVAIVAFCTVTAILLNTLFYWQYVASVSANPARQQEIMSIAFWTYLPGELTRRMAWVLVLPIALHYARILPMKAEKGLVDILRQVFLHVAISLVFGLIAALCTTTLVYALVPILFPKRILGSPMHELITHLILISGFTASVVLYWLILGGTNALAYYRAFQNQSLRAAALEAQLAQAQLHALQMQLNPHFLFNALNSVSSLLHEDVRRADTMLARLGEFLRMTLNAPLAQCVSLRQELEFVRRYLDIEQMRFEERVGVVWEVDDEALSASVPTFILQPLVENALKHGILLSSSGGTITIRASCCGDMVHLSVCNRTTTAVVRRSAQARERSNGNSMGIGLLNTRSRLEKLYQDAYTLDYGATEGEGFSVAIGIPFHRSGKTVPAFV